MRNALIVSNNSVKSSSFSFWIMNALASHHILFLVSLPYKFQSKKKFMGKISVGSWKFLTIQCTLRWSTQIMKLKINNKIRRLSVCRLCSMCSNYGYIASNNSCDYFQTSTSKIDEIISVAEHFKFEHRTTRRREKSIFWVIAFSKLTSKNRFSNKSNELWVASYGIEIEIIVNPCKEIGATSLCVFWEWHVSYFFSFLYLFPICSFRLNFSRATSYFYLIFDCFSNGAFERLLRTFSFCCHFYQFWSCLKK